MSSNLKSYPECDVFFNYSDVPMHGEFQSVLHEFNETTSENDIIKKIQYLVSIIILIRSTFEWTCKSNWTSLTYCRYQFQI